MEIAFQPKTLTADEIQSTQPELTDERRENAKRVLAGDLSSEPSDSSELMDLENQDRAQTPNPIDWESLSEVQRLEKSIEQFRLLGYPEEELQKMRETLAEAQEFFKQKVEQPTGEEKIEETAQQAEQEKKAFTLRQVGSIGLLIVIDSAFNHGYGTSQLLDSIMREQVMPGFMEKLGFDQELIDSLTSRRFDLGRGLFQLDHPSLVRFLSDMSKHDVYQLLERMSDSERQEFIEHGSFEHRQNLLSQDEIQKLLVNKLSDTQKQKLKIETKA